MKTRISAAGLARLQALDRPVERFERRLLGRFGRLGTPRLRALIRLLEAVQGAPG